ncbi:thiamine pyrophosphate-binding protein [Streptomyces sp. Ru72]|uniref:thiamine pyrophosphate-binding protein n=1 Tax=Streptomyces sp. Ru72 TaxID=2080747 RepID=UPI000CDE1BE8|nr:thiamine pyrophosphate-binding protein [Streptomyces sp. Ru72]POX50604.1 hypothetical protein C3488_13840 [Streptomyces sp. Ru72]
METIRLTTAQALVRFLAGQYSERDGQEQRLIPGVWGIFGHGNVAGLGQALLQAAVTGEADLPYYLARNEQGMVHASVAYAEMRDRLATFACTASTGPGSTNMIAGAALATTNRIPVLLLPSDMFATRVADPVLQQLEDTRGGDVTVNDAFRAVSKYFDRFSRPEQLIPAAPAAMRVLTDPVETGAVTLALPQDVQAEAYDWPVSFFRRRVWHVGRPVPEPAAVERAAHLLRGARRPLIVAGGGAVYSGAETHLRAFAEATGIPVADTHAGKGSVPWDHPCAVGGIGSTGAYAANELAKDADVVLGIGTRYSDFTTASHTVFGNPGVTFVNLNVARLDAVKHSADPLVADARLGIEALADALTGWQTAPEYRARTRELITRTREIVRYRNGDSGQLDGDVLPVDLAANASSLGADVLHATSVEEFRAAMEKAKAATRTTVVHAETDLYGPNPPGHGWWDVPVSQTSALESTRAAYETYAAHKQAQRHYL